MLYTAKKTKGYAEVMPIYEYECNECHYRFEIKQSFSDDSCVKCPDCSEDALHKVICPITVHYKGSGFQITEARGITGRKRRPNIKVGTVSNLPPEEREKYE